MLLKNKLFYDYLNKFNFTRERTILQPRSIIQLLYIMQAYNIQARSNWYIKILLKTLFKTPGKVLLFSKKLSKITTLQANVHGFTLYKKYKVTSMFKYRKNRHRRNRTRVRSDWLRMYTVILKKKIIMRKAGGLSCISGIVLIKQIARGKLNRRWRRRSRYRYLKMRWRFKRIQRLRRRWIRKKFNRTAVHLVKRTRRCKRSIIIVTKKRRHFITTVERSLVQTNSTIVSNINYTRGFISSNATSRVSLSFIVAVNCLMCDARQGYNITKTTSLNIIQQCTATDLYSMYIHRRCLFLFSAAFCAVRHNRIWRTIRFNRKVMHGVFGSYGRRAKKKLKILKYRHYHLYEKRGAGGYHKALHINHKNFANYFIPAAVQLGVLSNSVFFKEHGCYVGLKQVSSNKNLWCNFTILYKYNNVLNKYLPALIQFAYSGLFYNAYNYGYNNNNYHSFYGIGSKEWFFMYWVLIKNHHRIIHTTQYRIVQL